MRPRSTKHTRTHTHTHTHAHTRARAARTHAHTHTPEQKSAIGRRVDGRCRRGVDVPREGRIVDRRVVGWVRCHRRRRTHGKREKQQRKRHGWTSSSVRSQSPGRSQRSVPPLRAGAGQRSAASERPAGARGIRPEPAGAPPPPPAVRAGATGLDSSKEGCAAGRKASGGGEPAGRASNP